VGGEDDAFWDMTGKTVGVFHLPPKPVLSLLHTLFLPLHFNSSLALSVCSYTLLLSVDFRLQKDAKMSFGRVIIQKWVKKWYHRWMKPEDTYLSPGPVKTDLERAAACMVASFPQAKLTQGAMYKVVKEYHTTWRTATGAPVKPRKRKLKEGQAPPAPKEHVAKLFPLDTLQFTYI
jgi:2-succinyl-5-enolpyruvyl-6-hydroxy-3-cyclohexene-1-carboxylate synthase